MSGSLTIEGVLSEAASKTVMPCVSKPIEVCTTASAAAMRRSVSAYGSRPAKTTDAAGFSFSASRRAAFSWPPPPMTSTSALAETLRAAAAEIEDATAPTPDPSIRERFRQSSRTAAMVEVYNRAQA